MDSLDGRRIAQIPVHCAQIDCGRTQCQGRREGVRKILLQCDGKYRSGLTLKSAHVE